MILYFLILTPTANNRQQPSFIHTKLIIITQNQVNLMLPQTKPLASFNQPVYSPWNNLTMEEDEITSNMLFSTMYDNQNQHQLFSIFIGRHDLSIQNCFLKTNLTTRSTMSSPQSTSRREKNCISAKTRKRVYFPEAKNKIKTKKSFSIHAKKVQDHLFSSSQVMCLNFKDEKKKSQAALSHSQKYQNIFTNSKEKKSRHQKQQKNILNTFTWTSTLTNNQIKPSFTEKNIPTAQISPINKQRASFSIKRSLLRMAKSRKIVLL